MALHKQIARNIRHRYSPKLRARGRVLKQFSESIGLVHFGSVHHSDDHEVVRGFSASTTHVDADVSVGTYDGYDIRILNRYDTVPLMGSRTHEQFWTIFEVKLSTATVPHVVFVPTGGQGGEYTRLFTAQPHMQPLNTMLLHNKSSEVHGRFQILARTSHAHRIEELFVSPIIVGIGARFWPHGIEVHNGTLYVYITEQRLTRPLLETTMASTLWLAEMLDDNQVGIKEKQ